MITSDGISDKDWSEVEGLAFSIASTTEKEGDTSGLINKLINKLDYLEKKYGRLPSITATRADYTNNLSQQLSLLKEAYVSALEIDDKKNMAYIAASIAEIYMDNEEDLHKIIFWASVFTGYLKTLTKNDEYLSFVKDEIDQHLISIKGSAL